MLALVTVRIRNGHKLSDRREFSRPTRQAALLRAKYPVGTLWCSNLTTPVEIATSRPSTAGSVPQVSLEGGHEKPTARGTPGRRQNKGQHQPISALISIGFAALRSAKESAIASATSASIRPELLALSNLRPPAGSRATALAAHHCRTGCAPWRNFFWTTKRSTMSTAGLMSL
jgi:hypothetical protein